jgi:hypothetical protein
MSNYFSHSFIQAQIKIRGIQQYFAVDFAGMEADLNLLNIYIISLYYKI